MGQKYEVKHTTDLAKQCESQSRGGNPCTNEKVEGSNFCPLHGGNRAGQVAAKKEFMNYELAKWKAEGLRKLNSPELKSTREEIVLLRILLQRLIEKTQDGTDLEINRGPMVLLISQIDKLVTNCHKTELSMGQLLDKTQLTVFISMILLILTEELGPDNKAMLERISNRIAQSVASLDDVKDE